MNPTLKLLRQIGTPFEPDKIWENPKECKEIFQYAFKNRVGLLYLLSLKKTGRLDELTAEYEKLDFRARETLDTTGRAGEVMNRSEIDYVIFKTIRPYPATPNDADILCLGETADYKKAVQTFYDAKYFTFDKFAPLQVQFSDPKGKDVATWDKKGGMFYIDLYRMPGADYFVYLDPEKLKKQIVFTDINGHKIKTLRPEVELAAILTHSVFPEATFPLEIFYTVTYYLSQFHKEQKVRFINFANDNYISFPIRIALSISSFLHLQAFGYKPQVIAELSEELGGEYPKEIMSFKAKKMKVPYKYLKTSFILTFLKKLREYSSLKSLGVQGVHMINPIFMRDVLSSLYIKMTTGSYAQT